MHHALFFLIFGHLKELQNLNLNFFSPLNTSISTRNVLIHSMFISEVNYMRSFVLQVDVSYLKKTNI
jgi:hypothetical protein